MVNCFVLVDDFYLFVCIGNINWIQQVKNEVEDMKVGEYGFGDFRRLGEELGIDMIKIVYTYESFKIEIILKFYSQKIGKIV